MPPQHQKQNIVVSNSTQDNLGVEDVRQCTDQLRFDWLMRGNNQIISTLKSL
jgi:hypothetical protein